MRKAGLTSAWRSRIARPTWVTEGATKLHTRFFACHRGRDEATFKGNPLTTKSTSWSKSKMILSRPIKKNYYRIYCFITLDHEFCPWSSLFEISGGLNCRWAIWWVRRSLYIRGGNEKQCLYWYYFVVDALLQAFSKLRPFVIWQRFRFL